MPRPRTKDVGLPKHVYLKHGAYYFVDENKKWNRIGSTQTEMRHFVATRAGKRIPIRYHGPAEPPSITPFKSPITREARRWCAEEFLDDQEAEDAWCLRFDVNNRINAIVQKFLQKQYGRGTTSVYVIGAAGMDMPVKIGFAADVDKRMLSLRNSSPIPAPLEIRASFMFKSSELARDVEQLAHLKYWKYRSHGEWFYALAEDVAAWLEEVCRPLKPIKRVISPPLQPLERQ